ncbi:site-specific integrase [Streptomyces sp. NPDC004435]|uniref:site-specific integrase n=1 Tax=Streptomyces sp. NPDC004435 TaxID=3364701 RepID=UPI00369DE021
MAELLGEVLPGRAGRTGNPDVQDGQRFVIGPDGRPDLRVNWCLGSAKWRRLAWRTQRDYAYSLSVWLNYLITVGVNWWDADHEVASEFLFWRVTDPANEDPVETGTFARDLAGLKKFYKLAARFGVLDPFADMDAPSIVRHADVKWLDPGGYARWVDLGIRGLDLQGRPDPWWKGRNDQRDRAFCDGLYGNGLRVSEWASVVLPELPAYDRRRGFFTCELAEACAKGGYGHKYWMPRSALRGVLSYVEGARAAAVRRAQAAGRYERIIGRRTVLALHGMHSVTMSSADGGSRKEEWNDVGPQTRKLLFQQTDQGLEPVALWLNEDGLPRDGGGWEHTFDVANKRIESLGLENFSCTAHMLRHSFALRWYSVGKLIKYSRLGHLTEDEQRDFREEVGNTWHLVQTMLGHRNVETTKNVYLGPFKTLEVEVLLAHADDFPVASFMANVFAEHPWVRTDPLAVAK